MYFSYVTCNVILYVTCNVISVLYLLSLMTDMSVLSKAFRRVKRKINKFKSKATGTGVDTNTYLDGKS
jgi:hypothetical protein